MKNLPCVLLLGLVWFFAGCASTKQNLTNPTPSDTKPVATIPAFELELEPPPGGTILVLGDDMKTAPLPRAEELKKRYGAEELKMKSMVYIFPDGDEMWIQTASKWGAFQSKTYWTVVTRPMPALDMASIDFSSEEGKRLIRRHNERVLAMEQGRFAKKEYGMQTGDGYVPVLARLLEAAGLAYVAKSIGDNGNGGVDLNNSNINVNKPVTTSNAHAGP